jgi:hypothetical protein
MSNALVDNSATALLVEVEDFAGTPSSPLGSYLRLGAVPTDIVSAYDSLNNDSIADDDSALTETSGEDLARQVMGFVDDTRYRGEEDSDYLTLTEEERQDKSKLLHTKGGWRDHTDGNRITTTRGDKVEVIGGNYKLLVLGREQWNTDEDGNAYGVGLHNESSGGITYHYDEVPGQIIDVRRASDGSTWEVIEECQTGHFVARYHGVDKDWHTGGDRVTRVGSRGAYRVYKDSATWDDVKEDLGFVDDDDFDKPSNASHLADDFWPGDSTLPEVREEVFADSVVDRVIASGDIIDEDGSQSYPADEHLSKVYADYIEDIQTFDIYKQTMKGAKDSSQATESWKGIFFELFVACAVTGKYGFFWDFRYGTFCSMVNIAAVLAQVNLCGKRAQATLATIYIDRNITPLSNKARLAPIIYDLAPSKKSFSATDFSKYLKLNMG